MKQKYVLIGGFTLMFGVSLGLILFERGQSKTLRSDVAARPGLESIRGANTALDNSLAIYRQEAVKTAAILGQITNKADLGKIIDALLAMNVPAPYRDLHFKLTALAGYLKNEPQPDIDYLGEQIRLLKAEFPWL